MSELGSSSSDRQTVRGWRDWRRGERGRGCRAGGDGDAAGGAASGQPPRHSTWFLFGWVGRRAIRGPGVATSSADTPWSLGSHWGRGRKVPTLWLQVRPRIGGWEALFC